MRTAKTIQFYEQVYREAFPDPNQAETPDVWLPLMQQTHANGKPALSILLACDDQEQIAGGAVLERFRAADCWLLSYIAVQPASRGQGVATGLIAAVVRAIAVHNETDPLLLAEAEDPRQFAIGAERSVAELRLCALDALGMRQVLLDYVQPALEPKKQGVNLLLLHYDPKQLCRNLPAARLAKFLAAFYCTCEQAGSSYLHDALWKLVKQNLIPTQRLTLLIGHRRD